jgi:uncharacterized protein YrrD
MTRLVRATELMGLPIVTLDTAAAIGEVRDVLFDPARSRVVAYTVRGRGLLSPPLIGLLPVSAVASIGHDAVMTTSEAAILREREGMSAALDNQIEVLGKEVVSDNGEALGNVLDVVLEMEGGDAVVVGAEIDRPAEGRVILPLPAGIPLSPDALIVPAIAEPYAANGLAGFRDVLSRARSARAVATREEAREGARV